MPNLAASTLALALLLAALPAQAQPDDDDTNAIDDTPHVTIVGTASVEVVPDIAEISLGVATERASAAEASADTATAARAIIDAAKAKGVEARDIRTLSITLTQVFDELRDANGRYTGRRPRGFSAGNTVVIRVRALDKAGALAQELIQKGATQFNGITFTLDHPQPLEDKLLADAVRDARRKASIAAEALGAKLGRVLLIERPHVETPGYAMTRSRMAAAPPVPVEAGTQTLVRDIEVTWALEP